MHYIIYWDLSLLLNAVIDLSILIVLALILKLEISWWRMLLAIALGSGCSLLQVMVPFIRYGAGYLLYLLIIGSLMLIITFGMCKYREFVYRFIYLLVLTVINAGVVQLGIRTLMKDVSSLTEAAYGGIISGGNISGISINGVRIILLCAFVAEICILLINEGFQRSRGLPRSMEYRGRIRLGDSSLIGNGIVDTGNLLIDPISMQPVAVANYQWLSRILPDEYQPLVREYVENGSINYDYIAEHTLRRVRQIPFRTISEENGKMLGVQMDTLILSNQDSYAYASPIVIGISRTSFGSQGRYDLLIPEAYITMLEFISRQTIKSKRK